MLNATIFALTAGSFSHSPLIAASRHNNFHSYSCTFSSLFSPAILSSYNKMNSFISERSTFKNIIGTGIILESKSYANQIFEKTLKEQSTIITVQSCLFTNCVSSDNGGGIQVTMASSDVQIFSTGFTNCKSSNSGGAFYIISKKFLIEKSCIMSCSADECDAFFYSNQNFNHEDEFKLTYVYSISSTSTSASAIYFDSAEPNIQNNNITSIKGIAIKSVLEIEEFNSIVFQYNTFVSNCGKSILHFQEFKGEVRNCNFDDNQATKHLIHFGSSTSGQLKICFCCFMRDISTAYDDTYSLFLDCVFDHPNDGDKFPNKDLMLRCTFNSKYTTNDIDIQDMSKNGCWALVPNTPTEITPLITNEPESGSTLSSTLYGVLVVAAIVVICILAFFVYRWWINRRSKDNLLTMYAQV